MKSEALNWDDVRIFLALARSSSLRVAAGQLGLDRSTLSRRLAALEARLGTRLFVRVRDGVIPAEACERVRPLAERMEAAALGLTRAATARDSTVRGVVRVATTEAFGAFLVERGLLSLGDRHPELTLELSAGNAPVDVARGEADVALRLSPVREASLRVRCVGRFALGLFASETYLRHRGPVAQGDSLRGHDLLLPLGPLAHLPENRWLASQEGAHAVFRSDNMLALLAAAAADRGIVAVALPWGEAHPRLERVRVLEQVPKRPLWLVTREGESRQPAIRAVCDAIIAICAQALGPPPRD